MGILALALFLTAYYVQAKPIVVVAAAVFGFWVTCPNPQPVAVYGTQAAFAGPQDALPAVPRVRTAVARNSTASTAQGGGVALSSSSDREADVDALAVEFGNLTITYYGCMRNPHVTGRKRKRVVIDERLNDVVEVPVIWIDAEGDVLMRD